jgi:O-antigen ligase
VSFNTPWSWKSMIGVIFATTLWSPAHGLLVAIVMAPLGQLILGWLDAGAFRIGEAAVLAFLAGWLLRGPTGWQRQGPGVRASAFGWLLGLAIAASVGVQWWRLAHASIETDSTFVLLYHTYYIASDSIGFQDGARLVEGLAIAAAVVLLLRERPRLAIELPVAVVGAAVIAAASSVLLWYGIAPLSILKRHALLGDRVSAHTPDINAAGSYFALVLCAAGGMAVRSRRWTRFAWLAAAAVVCTGLWLSRSSEAFAACGIVAAAVLMWLAIMRLSRRASLIAFSIAVVATAIAAPTLLGGLRDAIREGASYRHEFNSTSMRMIRASPWLGVGEGQYYRASVLFLGPRIAWTYGKENAHNYFLQVAAELGVVGFGLFAIWVGAALYQMTRAVNVAPKDARLVGLAAGVLAFLATSFVGHPLLVDEVAPVFWAVFGLAIGLSGAASWHRVARAVPPTRELGWWIVPAIAAALVLSVAAPSRWRDPRMPDDREVDGFSDWHTGSDGIRFRQMGEYGSLFVPADIRRIEVPVRIPAGAALASPAPVMVRAEGLQVRQLVGGTWTILALNLPDVFPSERFKRVNLRVLPGLIPAAASADSGSRLMLEVGQPRIVRND